MKAWFLISCDHIFFIKRPKRFLLTDRYEIKNHAANQFTGKMVSFEMISNKEIILK